jgi:hypothetical protein
VTLINPKIWIDSFAPNIQSFQAFQLQTVVFYTTFTYDDSDNELDENDDLCSLI